MRNPNLKKWSYRDELEGLLFFAQTLDELLFYHTLDSFKAPALNAHTCLHELRVHAHSLRAGRIRRGTLSPVLEEAHAAIRKDPVFTVAQRSLLAGTLTRLMKDSGSPHVLVDCAEWMVRSVGAYYCVRPRPAPS